MTKHHFKTIALVGKPKNNQTTQTHECLYQWLIQQGYRPILDSRLKSEVIIPKALFMDLEHIGEVADLAIVVGGDGNMLGCARILSQYNIAVIGVNRGRLGFLADLPPESFERPLLDVLSGEYQSEQRFLLKAEIYRNGLLQSSNLALNETVLCHTQVANMLRFNVYLNDLFAFSQLSDGLIIATPTGSTAYALSGGGPILSPNAHVINLIPMFPHTLSNRPLVIDANDHIKLIVSDEISGKQEIRCDGQVALSVETGDEVHISKAEETLHLIHPLSYSYYHTLSNKLGWSRQLF